MTLCRCTNTTSNPGSKNGSEWGHGALGSVGACCLNPVRSMMAAVIKKGESFSWKWSCVSVWQQQHRNRCLWEQTSGFSLLRYSSEDLLPWFIPFLSPFFSEEHLQYFQTIISVFNCIYIHNNNSGSQWGGCFRAIGRSPMIMSNIIGVERKCIIPQPVMYFHQKIWE